LFAFSVRISSDEDSSSSSSSEEEEEDYFEMPAVQEPDSEEEHLYRPQRKKQNTGTGTGSGPAEEFSIGEFVTAVWEGQWLVAQVDTDQAMAGSTHVNLSYMERVGYNQFKWPKTPDVLLTLKEDILTKGVCPGLVGSSIRANHVGLGTDEAQAADAALAAVVYLQPFLIFLFFLVLQFNEVQILIGLRLKMVEDKLPYHYYERKNKMNMITIFFICFNYQYC
jgi:hypothetical protein